MIYPKILFMLVTTLLLVSTGDTLLAQSPSPSFAEGLPALQIRSSGEDETTYSLSLQILALMTGLTLLPSIVLGATSFTRIISLVFRLL